MNYETMEALLVQKIAELRESEVRFEQSLRLVKNDTPDINLNAEYRRLHARMAEVETLLAHMENAAQEPAIPAFMNAQPVSANAWV